jgi:hypothetical protein
MTSTHYAFNNDRIRDNEDKVLLERINEYFGAFSVADADKMNSMVADDYHMTDIRKSSFLSSQLPL